MPPLLCPNCSEPMQAQQYERHDQGTVRVDLCYSCSGLWFDHLASLQLAPSAVLELFKQINAHCKDTQHPVTNHLACPRCRNALTLSFDLCKSGRFSYYRCSACDGRFTPFFQFLREKQFIRELTATEVQHLRSQVRQIRCSECGAPVDLEHDTQCRYCHAPISFLDPDAVDKALRMWTDAEQRRHPGAAAEALGSALQRLPSHRPLGDHLLLTGSNSYSGGPHDSLDLIALGVQAVARLFEGHD